MLTIIFLHIPSFIIINKFSLAKTTVGKKIYMKYIAQFTMVFNPSY